MDGKNTDPSFYRFAVSTCGAASAGCPRRGARRTAPRGRSSLMQHFKLKHRAGRGLALRVIKRILPVETKNEGQIR
jgi:hypothetical protein